MNKQEIELNIERKKSEIQKSCDKGIAVNCKALNTLKFSDEETKALKIDSDYYYIVVNTTKILDSHDDLHVDGIWKKSIQEIQGKNYLVCDHDLEIESVIVRKEHIEILTAKLSFQSLGYSYEGNTEALIYKVKKDKVKQSIREWLDSGDSIEASVRMQYVQILFAMDSNDPEYSTYKETYDKYLDQIANKADFDYIPYFYVIKEAKNVKESSLVLFGSNHVTGNAQKKMEMENKNKNIEFIDMMIQHHEMAIKMANEYKDNVSNQDLKLIIENIIVSQSNEISVMNSIKLLENNKKQPTEVTEMKNEPSKDTQTKKRRILI